MKRSVAHPGFPQRQARPPRGERCDALLMVRPAVPGPPRWRKRQVFCRTACRRAFHAAARSWVLAGLAAGHIAILDVKNGPLATRALSGSPISPSPTHEGPPQQPASAEEQECLSDDFRQLLHEMDEILEEPTIPLLVRLRWLVPGRQRDHAAVVHGLCGFVGHVLAKTRNARP
jgi:hypothetical protein